MTDTKKMTLLIQSKILDRSAQVTVIGLGYVGLPLALEAAKAGFRVVGIDRDPARVEKINRGESYILDVDSGVLEQAVETGRLSASNDFRHLSEADVIIICVPTPLNRRKEPDLSCIEDAVNEICRYSKNGQLISLESTTYPGTTEEIIAKKMRSLGREPGKNVFIAFAPERLDPGNKFFSTANTPKIVGGVTKECLQVASCFYQQIINQVKTVSSPAVAEMSKILENTFRAVNISLVNELMLFCDRIGINIWEVVDAAATKPFGMQTFYPGPGIGGHCISVDPFYLSWKAKEYDFHFGFIEWAGRINSRVNQHMVNKVSLALNDRRHCLNGSRILILGVTYKKDVGDTRESPALPIMEKLFAAKADVRFFDPFISQIVLKGGIIIERVQLTDVELSQADCVLIIADHSDIDYQWVVDRAQLVVDTRNATKSVTEGRAKIVRI